MKTAFLIAGSLSLLSAMTLAAPVSAKDSVPAESQPVTTVEEPSSTIDTAEALPTAEATESLPLTDVSAQDTEPDSQLTNPSVTSTSTPLLSSLIEDEDDLGQTPSVTQLSDVLPTDWAYQAVRSLFERYGCIAGYPDGTFQGNRQATRYELAAALNACLDQISTRLVTKEEFAAVTALQEEFKTELTTLRGRVDSLEERADILEEQQFSRTTKLQGLAVFVGQFGDTTGNGFTNPTTGTTVNSGTTNPTVLSFSKLDFNTSLSGSDLLQTSIAVGNNGEDAFSGLGLFTSPDASGNAGQPTFAALGINSLALYPNQAFLYRLAYTFSPADNLSLTFGPQVYPADFFDYSSYANVFYNDFSSFALINNPLINPFFLNFFGGAGGGLDWNVDGGPVSVRATYVAGSPFNATDNANGGGLFGDPFQASAELEYADSFGSSGANNFAVRLQYTNSTTLDVSQNAVGVNAEVTFGRVGIFGRYAFSFAEANGTATAPAPLGEIDFDAQAWMAGIGFNDLLFEGSLLAAAAGQPFINDLPPTVTFGPNTSTQTNYEAFFRIPVNNNISVTPGVMVITDANNQEQPTLIQGFIRSTFSF